MTHPLTNKVLVDLYQKTLAKRSQNGDGVTSAPVDFMRGAADWQLEQVIEQWEEVMDSTMTDIQVIREFDKRLKAMRPQEES